MAFSVGLDEGCTGFPEKGYIVIFVTSDTSEVFTIELKDLSNVTLQTITSSFTNNVTNSFSGLDNATYRVKVTGSITGDAAGYSWGDIDSPVYTGISIPINCVSSPTCNLAITNIVAVTDVNAQSKGSITVTATSTYPIQYSINGGVQWFSSGSFINLPQGTYKVNVRDSVGCQAVQNNVIVGNLACGLTISSFSKGDETGEGLNDGTATIVAVTSYSDTIQYKLDNGSWVSSGVFTGISSGDHIIYVRNNYSCTAQQAFTIVPFIVIVPYTYVPTINSLRFVTPVTPNYCSTFQTLDNTLFNDFVAPGFHKKCYYQKVAKCDTMVIQWHSNYATNTIVLTNESTSVQYSFVGALATLPVGYIAPEDYNIIEATINYTAVPNGYYSVKIIGTDPAIGDYELLGEPIHLATTHLGTNLIAYKNFDQAFEIEYLTGIIHKIRIESLFVEGSNPGKREIIEDSERRTIKLNGYVKRKIKLRTYTLPQYLHEKLSQVFEHDYFTVNGVEFQSEENYDYKFPNLVLLGSGETDLTQVNFKKSNSHDGGDINSADGGFIQVEGGLLKY